MPTVYLPLGSAEAYGRVGEMVIYQGTWVRRYVVPRDPRTDAQLDVRKLFHDITKMVKSGNSWARGTWVSLGGPRWFTNLYRDISTDFMGSWTAAQTDWDAMSEGEQTSWNDVAPYQATWNQPGRIFFSVARVVAQLLDASGYPDYELAIADASNSGDVVAWWNRELDGVLIEGMYDDDQSEFVYSENWEVVEHASAYGGSYHQQSGAGLAKCNFYFTGTGFRAFYKRDVGLGILQLRTEDEHLNVDISDASPTWQQSSAITGLFQGLHYGIVQWHELGLINLDAIEIIR